MGEGQLDDELEKNSWIVAELDLVQIMAGGNDLWNRAVNKWDQNINPGPYSPKILRLTKRECNPV